MPREIFINVTPYENRVAVMRDGHIEEFYAERSDSVNIVGNIYKAKVESVVPGIGAAFVDLGVEKNGFLYVSDVVTGLSSYEKLLEEEAEEEAIEKFERQKPLPSINELLKKDDEVLVQVVKEPIGTKGPRLTTHISLAGRFLVLMPFDKRIGMSRRIEDKKERERIRNILTELKASEGMGMIARTAAVGVSQKDFFREGRYLTRLWRHIKERSKRTRPPQLIHQEYDLILRVVRDIFTDEVSRLEVDSRKSFKMIMRLLRISSPHLRSRLRLYRDNIPIFERYNIEKHIAKIYNRTVQLKSGGYLVFDETESLVAIDVNSGKFVGRKNLEDTAFKTNLEAAEEIPRQLKLRDIGGIIIIDFIDMEQDQHRRVVARTLEKALEGDRAKKKILNISSIGLVEMTRQRMRRSVEGKSYAKCPYCNGRGAVKSAETVSIEVARNLERFLQGAQARKARDITVELNPEVASYILTKSANMLKPFERRFRKYIHILKNPNLHMEDMKIEEARS